MRRFVPLYFYAVVLLFVSCTTVIQSTAVKYRDYKASNKQPFNNALIKLLNPYADSVNNSINDVIAVATG